MDSIYSYILWDKMGNTPENYKIHEKSNGEIFDDFKSYILSSGPEVFYSDILDLSVFTKTEEDGYYDGPFYKCQIPVHISNIKESEENGEDYRTVNIHMHDSSIEPVILTWMMDFMTPDDVDFLAKLHREYYKNKKAEATLDVNDSSEGV
jgi:hypothetical protein